VANEAELGAVFQRLRGGSGGNGASGGSGASERAHVIGVDFARLSFGAQLALVAHSTLLVGVHGAGLSHALFLPTGGSLLELTPPEYAARPHFKYFASWADRPYRTLSVGADRGAGHHVDPAALERTLREVLGLQEGGAGGPTRPIATPSLAWERNWQPNAAAPPTAASAYIGAGGSVALSQSGGRGPSYTPGMLPDPIPSDTTSAALDESFVEEGWNRGPSHNDGHRLCILVPFRDSTDKTSQGSNRTENLMEFIPYMIRHLTDNAGTKRENHHSA